MINLTWIYNDGGRQAAGFKGKAGDCVCRAAAIATGLPYRDVYDELALMGKQEKIRGNRPRSHPRTGVSMKLLGEFMKKHGFEWVPTMGIGTGCTVHLDPNELPMGRLVCRVSGHVVAVIDGVIMDVYNPSRKGKRCVYGYWREKK